MMDRLTDPETLLVLARWLEAASLDVIEITHGETRVVVRVGAAAEIARAVPVSVPAPMAGRMLNAHPARHAPAEDLAAGEAAAFVQIGPILIPAVAPQAARVADRPVPDGALIGHGDAIVALEAK